VRKTTVNKLRIPGHQAETFQVLATQSWHSFQETEHVQKGHFKAFLKQDARMLIKHSFEDST
jgi:hypothetical protein